MRLNSIRTRGTVVVLTVTLGLPGFASAQDADAPAKNQGVAVVEPAEETVDPRAGDEAYERAKALLAAIDDILEDTAEQRADQRKLPSKDEFLVPPVFTETKEDREDKIRKLLDSALAIVTDVPIVDLQKELEGRRRNIRDLEDQIAELKARQLTAPDDALMPGILNDTVESLGKEIADLEERIAGNRAEIETSKGEIALALAKSGVKMEPGQLDLLLDSVLSGDLVRLVAAFNAARLIDEQLAKAVQATGDNLGTARKFFAMHSALFAMLVHGQDAMIKKIDNTYLPRLEAILGDVKTTRKETERLLKEKNRPDQKRALEANLKSQDFAEEVANYYRGYLLQQREQLVSARLKAVKDLRIADNTYETVEASFQLRALIKDAAASFEAIQKLEAPGFEQIFENQELRREFENLTRKLDVPGS
ncbi:MAG: hypothetical protein R3D57_00445 [Hyphomicrobiaceae bacterium]